MIVYSQALIFVPTLYLSRLAKALYKVSWYKSAAASGSRVKVIATGFKKSTLLVSSWLNSEFDTVILFNDYNVKIKQKTIPEVARSLKFRSV